MSNLTPRINDDLIPGLTNDQDNALEFSLRMVPSALHDGICIAINAALGNSGGPYSDQEVMACIVVSLIRCSGLAIPNTLFESDIGVKADSNQILSGKAGLNGGGTFKAN
jgi:hypothetical protein